MRRPHGRRGHPRASPHPCGGARTVGAAWGDEAAPPWPRPLAHTPLCNASSPRSLPSRLRTLQGIFPLADVLRPRLSQLLCVRQFHDNTSCFLKVAVAGPSLTLTGRLSRSRDHLSRSQERLSRSQDRLSRSEDRLSRSLCVPARAPVQPRAALCSAASQGSWAGSGNFLASITTHPGLASSHLGMSCCSTTIKSLSSILICETAWLLSVRKILQT